MSAKKSDKSIKEIKVEDATVIDPALTKAIEEADETIDREEEFKEAEMRAAELLAEEKEKAAELLASKVKEETQVDDGLDTKIYKSLLKYKAKSHVAGKVVQASRGGIHMNVITREQWIPISVVKAIITDILGDE